MKTKKYLSIIVTILLAFSPLIILPAKVFANGDDDVYTVILKSGEGHGDDVTIKSTDDGALVPAAAYAHAGNFYSYEGHMYYNTPEIPASFSSPANKTNSLAGWNYEGTSYGINKTIEMPESNNRTITLTAEWSDSWFKIETPNSVEISGPGYTNFKCKLTGLHLGKYNGPRGSKYIAENFKIAYQKGDLTHGSEKLPYLVRSTEETDSSPTDEAFSPTFTEDNINSEFEMSIYISPEDYDNAKSGTYTGSLICKGVYNYRYEGGFGAPRPGQSASQSEQTIYEGEDVSLEIPLTITIGSEEAEYEIADQYYDDIAASEEEPLSDAPSTQNKETNGDAKANDIQIFPQTGDKTNMPILVTLLVISVLGLTIALISRKNNHKAKHKK